MYDLGYAHPLTEADTLGEYVGKNVTLRCKFGDHWDAVPPPPIVYFHGETIVMEVHPATGRRRCSMFFWDLPESGQEITVIGTLERWTGVPTRPEVLSGRGRWLQLNYVIRDAFWYDASEEGVSANSSR